MGNHLCLQGVRSGWRLDGAIRIDTSLWGEAEALMALVDFALKAAWVEELDFSHTGLTAEDAATLTAAMLQSPHRQHLQKLDFTGNDFGDEGAAAFARALPQLHLNYLLMWDNGISDAGALAIAKALLQCTTLRHLRISDRSIGKETRHALREVCAKKDPKNHTSPT
ncbi:NLRC5 [Symbiodinium pilosum]|uniref:NLRC5 protein n=1 Tax=Symbiodinium pilosum TaxID=2952 RepID=A0A812TK94_SYMPI|nr:NLRC5 [Symbiodinium pilosum]